KRAAAFADEHNRQVVVVVAIAVAVAAAVRIAGGEPAPVGTDGQTTEGECRSEAVQCAPGFRVGDDQAALRVARNRPTAIRCKADGPYGGPVAFHAIALAPAFQLPGVDGPAHRAGNRALAITREGHREGRILRD